MATSMSYKVVPRMSQALSCSRTLSASRFFWLNHIRHKSGTVSPQDPEKLFVRRDVQSILRKITGFDLDIIFKERFTNVRTPKYQLLTDAEYAKVQQEAARKARAKLQMPPVKNPRSTEPTIICVDSEIEGHDDHPYVFTDITYGLPDKARVIVVREPDGTLRHATGDERDRILNIYFPRPGRAYHFPKMFTEHPLEQLLQNGKYVYVLDRACVQFEPDDHNFIRVTHRVYEHIADHKAYNDLYSTRHFGPMALYLACNNRIEGLMADMIKRERLSDAASMVRLHNIIFPDTESAKLYGKDPNVSHEELIKTFAEKDSRQGGIVQLALQAYREAKQPAEAHSA